MRRVIFAVTGTIAGLVALLSFKAHVPTVPVAATSGTGGSSTSSSSSSSSSSSRTIPGEFQSVAGPLTAQNAKVDAVSGASYTSAGYISSLQSAVDHGL